MIIFSVGSIMAISNINNVCVVDNLCHCGIIYVIMRSSMRLCAHLCHRAIISVIVRLLCSGRSCVPFCGCRHKTNHHHHHRQLFISPSVAHTIANIIINVAIISTLLLHSSTDGCYSHTFVFTVASTNRRLHNHRAVFSSPSSSPDG